MTRWRLLRTFDSPPELAMGLDEALLVLHGPPTLRFYTWQPDTLSLGYFQRPADVPGSERAGALVRRLTGGGAIHHARELTFSLTTSRADVLYRGPLAGSYERVHHAIADALRGLGVDAYLRRDAELASERDGTGMCFHRSSALDLCWNGRKGLGSAQRRRRDRVLHHGSLKLGPFGLDTGVASVPSDLSAEELAELLLPHLARRLELELVAEAPTPAELTAAARLGARYTAGDWVGGSRGW